MDREYVLSQAVTVSDNSPYEDIRQLGDALRHNPPIFLKLGNPLLDKLWADGTRVITCTSELEVYQQHRADDCDWQFVVLDSVKLAFGVMLAPHVNQTTVDCLNVAIGESSAELTNELEAFRSKQLQLYEGCRKQKAESLRSPIGSPLKLVRLAETFVILAVGLVLAAIWFVLEIVRASDWWAPDFCSSVAQMGFGTQL